MIRILVLSAGLLLLQGCVALPLAVFAVEAISDAAAVTETTCRTGEVLTASDPALLAAHPDLQTAEKACEALAP